MVERNQNSKIINQISKKQKRLEKVQKQLKRHFVGIDDLIDKIIRDIEAWYVAPELLTRPVVICLWGPTGVGKTDLVRRLVKGLSFQDRYCEIELMNKGNSNYKYHSSISSILSSNANIVSGKSSIILLDEMQNFRTIDEEGNQFEEYKFRDVWGLLSDGKLPFNANVDYLFELLWKLNNKNKKDTNDDFDLDSCADFSSTDLNSYYGLKNFKEFLRLSEPIEEIAEWDVKTKKNIIMKKIKDPSLYEEEDFSNSLIFISGNIDDAYEFAKRVEESDVDADIFHEMSQNISIIDIKKALRKRFNPEQIARFGNNHVIYPIHSKKTYQTIISRKINQITKSVKNKFNIDVTIDNSIRNLIYNNGVYPTQGTRPVFSTISEILEATLPRFLLQSLINKEKSFSLFYENDLICATSNNKDIFYSLPYKGTLDKIKNKREKDYDQRILTSVHEAGHGVVYAVLFKLAPPQLSALGASSDTSGFLFPHEICESKDFMMNKICVFYGGLEAERLVFGQGNETLGSVSDNMKATSIAGQIVKRASMDRFVSYIISEENNNKVYNTFKNADVFIEKILKDNIAQTKQILSQNKKLLIDIVDYLIHNKQLQPEDFKKICKKRGLNVKLLKSRNGQNKIISPNYFKKYKMFKEQKNG